MEKFIWANDSKELHQTKVLPSVPYHAGHVAHDLLLRLLDSFDHFARAIGLEPGGCHTKSGNLWRKISLPPAKKKGILYIFWDGETNLMTYDQKNPESLFVRLAIYICIHTLECQLVG